MKAVFALAKLRNDLMPRKARLQRLRNRVIIKNTEDPQVQYYNGRIDEVEMIINEVDRLINEVAGK